MVRRDHPGATDMADPFAAFRLDGKRALVTGASKGIGREAAKALAAAGARVTLLARDGGLLATAVAGIRADGHEAESVACDVTDTAAMRAAVEATGPFDILFNNAGVNRPRPFLEVEEEIFDLIMNVNVRAAFMVAQAVARGMVAAGIKGVIVNTSSQMGHVGGPRRVPYCASKHAVEGMTKAMALELAPHGIRVAAIAPTFIETEMTRTMFADPAFLADVRARIPLDTLGAPPDVTGALLYLVSPAARLVTGSSLLVDGGWTAQ